ncbi:MAG: DUF378 domain-containing protein [Firmicutes bacterium]|nr:DUF378 domain-containing protein [Bacillota bacterium]
MRRWDFIALLLIIIGAINWGLVGFFRFDLVSAIFNGSTYWIARVIFAAIGLCGLYGITFFGRDRDHELNEEYPQPSR